VRRFQAVGRPDLWFTYHLYHKAPDWLVRPSPPGCASPMSSPKLPSLQTGRRPLGSRAPGRRRCDRRADRVFQLNPADTDCVRPLLRSPSALVRLPPFLDTAPLRAPDRAESRAAMALRLDLDPACPGSLPSR
jgi:hypothetical protein